MGDRRMLTRKITDDDKFIALSSSAQALYLHLSLSADDDGFSNQVSISMFRAHASVQDLEALLSNRFIIQFDDGVIVITHWRMANAIRKDRYTHTTFIEDFEKLKISEKGEYLLKSSDDVNDAVANWLPDGCQVVANRLPQDKLSKDKLNKIKEKDKEREKGLSESSSCKQDNIPYVDIISHLNSAAGTSFKPDSGKTRRCIHARFEEGFTKEDFFTAIDYKVMKWKDTDYDKYLRPETLFGTKFESYLQEALKNRTTDREVKSSAKKEFVKSMYPIFERHNDMNVDVPIWSAARYYPEEFTDEQRKWLVEHHYLKE